MELVGEGFGFPKCTVNLASITFPSKNWCTRLQEPKGNGASVLQLLNSWLNHC